MTSIACPTWSLIDQTPEHDDLAAELRAGLSASPKTLPCKLLYDERGSELFERVCELPEYYPTRTELAIMRRHVDDMAARLGPGVRLVELGSGASVKTPLLLDALDAPADYVPVEISASALAAACERLAEAFPGLPLHPIVADYTHGFTPPDPPDDAARTAVYFPGSTIGNFHRGEARAFLARLAGLVGPGGGLLIGVDLCKPLDVLLPAYDDAAGVTAAFNRNLLAHVNDRTGAGFDPQAFRHEAAWDADHRRIEMRLVATTEQRVTVGGEAFVVKRGEYLWTESSYKHTLGGFAALAEGLFDVVEAWTDDRGWFSVQYLEAR